MVSIPPIVILGWFKFIGFTMFYHISCIMLSYDQCYQCFGDSESPVGDCHHGARRHWPLLFSAGLRPAAESSFWFGEFCHALAHRSTGPGHGAHHSRVTLGCKKKREKDGEGWHLGSLVGSSIYHLVI